ncbi:endocytosis defective- protein [Mortierella alpina]|uniref:Endocytosis defective- protein n=1 Tax=Mortierella alpina TaxID=64518 RepID=A0A9P6M3Y5_MORAP|nr:endocytosis defective- protein [Mortierella alpina]
MDMSQAERQKYAEIFASLNPSGGYITGVQARQILMNSGLHVDMLGQIWDICDIDKDGNMDFDEFCLALRFVYASINGEIAEIPASLPQHLIPASKVHYFGGGGGGNQGYSQPYMQQPQPTGAFMTPPQSYSQSQPSNYNAISALDTAVASSNNLSDDFDWYIAPSDRTNYESIYQNNVQLSSGEVRMGQFEELYQALQIPREDINAAWSLVNVHGAPQIGKDQCIMFFHILNSRRLGKRVPSTLPGSLRTSFLGDSNFALSDNYAVHEIRQQPGRPSVPLSFATKSAFSSQKGHVMADDYLSRLNQKDQAAHETHAQEERLKQELESIKRQIEEAELRTRSSRGDSTVAKRELQDLLAYKQQQVLNDDASILERQLLDQDREIQRQRDALRQLDKVMQGLREQKDLLETHLADSESELRDSQREIESHRAR